MSDSVTVYCHTCGEAHHGMMHNCKAKKELSENIGQLENCPLCRGVVELHPTLTRINCTQCPLVLKGVQGREELVRHWNDRPEVYGKIVKLLCLLGIHRFTEWRDIGTDNYGKLIISSATCKRCLKSSRRLRTNSK